MFPIGPQSEKAYSRSLHPVRNGRTESKQSLELCPASIYWRSQISLLCEVEGTMCDQSGTLAAPNSRAGNEYGSARVALVAGMLVLLAGAGFWAYRQHMRTEERIAQLQARVAQSEKEGEEAAAISRSALSQAFRAEENARVAGEERTAAEGAKADAMKEASRARESAAAATEEARAAREKADQIRQRREAEIDRLQKALGKIADTQRTTLGLVMTLGSDSVKFDFDKATLRPENRELLSRIAGVLLTAYGFRIQVFGHTDDIGTNEYNQKLSEKRAQAVRDYLAQAGVSPDIMTAKGFGKSSPRVRGNNSDARAKNRRVEIGIVDTIINYQGEVAPKAADQ